MRWRQRRRLKKVRPGDGSELKKYHLWQAFSRSLFYIDLPREEAGESPGGEDTPDTYAVDVHFFAEDLWSAETADKLSEIGSSVEEFIFGPDNDGELEAGKKRKPQAPPAALYRNGLQITRANLPATFAVPGGIIEVESSLYGMSRIHYVAEGEAGETEIVLQPDRNAPEGLRARFDGHYPRTSKTIGWVAIVILVLGLVTGLPQVLELFTNMDVVSTWLGWSFESPIKLPNWANTTLFVAGILAATERALTLRNHWFLDMDTTWWSL